MMTPVMWFTLAVIVVPLSLVMLDRWRVDMAALFMIVALGLAQSLGLGVLGQAHDPAGALLAISGFSQPVIITLIGLFILTQALTSNGLMAWVGLRLTQISAGSETRMIFLFTSTAALLSLLMNNIAVGALLLPSAMQVSRNAGIKASRLLIPISFGTALGGMATYFTTANIVLSNLLMIATPPQAPLDFRSFFPVGSLIVIAGTAYLSFFGRRLLPIREPGPEQILARRASTDVERFYALGERLWQGRIRPDSPLVGKNLQQSRIGERFGIAIIAILRKQQAIFTPEATQVIQPNDVLLMVGREERVLLLNELGITPGRQNQAPAINRFDVTLVELILAPHSNYEGKTIKAMNFRRKYGFTAVALLRRGRSYRTDVGDMPLEAGDSLLMIGPRQWLRDLRINPDIIIFEPESAPRAVPLKRALFSLLILLGAVAASLAGLPTYLSVLAASVLALMVGLLSIQDIYRSIEWQVIFFIAGMYAASLAMINTGLVGLLGQTVIHFIESSGPLGLAGAAFLLSAALTQIIGSQATAFVVGPIAISAAIHLGVNPQAIAVTSAIGCSASFLTPTAHPVNLLMMSPGNYRFGDFFRVGFGLLLVTFTILLAGMILFWGL